MGITVKPGYGVRVNESDVRKIMERYGINDAEVSIAKRGDLVYFETTLMVSDVEVVATDREVYRSVGKAANQVAANCLVTQPSSA